MRFFELFTEVFQRNSVLSAFGTVHLLLAALFLVLSVWYPFEIAGANAWFKPFKFSISIGIYAFTMAWICAYLPAFRVQPFSWVIVVLLGLETVYIAIQAFRGLPSHFNVSTPVYSALYAGMAIAATGVALYTAYVGWLFMRTDFPQLHPAYVMGIRWGLLLFSLFALQGFMMGSRLSNTVRQVSPDWVVPILGWKLKSGDLRIAQFWGMHSLQVLPILGAGWIRNPIFILGLGILWGMVGMALIVLPFVLRRG